MQYAGLPPETKGRSERPFCPCSSVSYSAACLTPASSAALTFGGDIGRL
jgi:hypothetical protein